jgi:hypothetical protein
MLTCPSCDEPFSLTIRAYIKHMISGDVRCTRCRLRCEIVFHKPSLNALSLLFRVGVLGGMISLICVLFVQALLVLVNPWLTLKVSDNRGIIVVSCAVSVVLLPLLLYAGYRVQRFMQTRWSCRLQLFPGEVDLSNCPVCHTKAPSDAIKFGDVKVCPKCKDEYAHRLREGVGGG